MPDYFLLVIPRDVTADVPTNAEGLRRALADLAGNTESRVKNYGKLQFIDAGENFERVECPACAEHIDVDTWRGWMDDDWHGEEGFHLHRHETPCCGKTVTLNELVYYAPQGFARWFASARAGDRGPLTTEELVRLEQIAGLELKAIAQRY